jgi:hypothetical protein
MGDMAEFALEHIERDDELRADYRAGRLTPQAAYDHGLIDERGYEISPTIRPKTCRCCGAGQLHWRKAGAKWRLFDEKGEFHKCPKVPLRE